MLRVYSESPSMLAVYSPSSSLPPPTSSVPMCMPVPSGRDVSAGVTQHLSARSLRGVNKGGGGRGVVRRGEARGRASSCCVRWFERCVAGGEGCEAQAERADPPGRDEDG